MIAVNTDKVAATKVGLDITNRIFEVMGAICGLLPSMIQ